MENKNPSMREYVARRIFNADGWDRVPDAVREEYLEMATDAICAVRDHVVGSEDILCPTLFDNLGPEAHQIAAKFIIEGWLNAAMEDSV